MPCPICLSVLRFGYCCIEPKTGLGTMGSIKKDDVMSKLQIRNYSFQPQTPNENSSIDYPLVGINHTSK